MTVLFIILYTIMIVLLTIAATLFITSIVLDRKAERHESDADKYEQYVFRVVPDEEDVPEPCPFPEEEFDPGFYLDTVDVNGEALAINSYEDEVMYEKYELGWRLLTHIHQVFNNSKEENPYESDEDFLEICTDLIGINCMAYNDPIGQEYLGSLYEEDLSFCDFMVKQFSAKFVEYLKKNNIL